MEPLKTIAEEMQCDEIDTHDGAIVLDSANIPELNVDVIEEIMRHCTVETLKNCRLVCHGWNEIARYHFQQKSKVAITSSDQLSGFVSADVFDKALYPPSKGLSLDCSFLISPGFDVELMVSSLFAKFHAGITYLVLKNCGTETANIMPILQSPRLALLEEIYINPNCEMTLSETNEEENECQNFLCVKTLQLPALYGFQKTLWMLIHCPSLKKFIIERMADNSTERGKPSIDPMLDAIVSALNNNPTLKDTLEEVEIGARKMVVNKNGTRVTYSNCKAKLVRRKNQNPKTKFVCFLN